MSEINWSVILQVLIAAGVIYVIKGVSTINGSIKEIKTWQKGHETLDNLRYTETKDKFKTLFTELNKDK